MNKESGIYSPRLDYIDIAKGILIILVVLHHVPSITISILPSCVETLETILNVRERIYMSFFMTCFFIITGFCSNFNTPFPKFWQKNVLTILLPSLFFENYLHWFLGSMFLSKCIYYFLCRYTKSDLLQFSILSVLAIVGIFLLQRFSSLEQFYSFHAFILTVFLFIGDKCGKFLFQNKCLIISTISYVFISSLLAIYNYETPYLEYITNVTEINYPLFLVLSTSGSLMVIGISKLIGHNSFLIFCGKWSLVILLTHWKIETILLKILFRRGLLATDCCQTYIFVCLGTALVTLAVSCLICRFLDNKIGNYLLGKTKLKWSV